MTCPSRFETALGEQHPSQREEVAEGPRILEDKWPSWILGPDAVVIWVKRRDLALLQPSSPFPGFISEQTCMKPRKKEDDPARGMEAAMGVSARQN